MKEVLKEWFVSAPWGRIALMSWGNPNGKSLLLIHGRQDSAASFLPILELLPMKYHYVALELPGHGKSDPFPDGVKLMRIHFVHTIDVVVKHLKWKKFMVMAHSMGSELALFYNAVHPKRIKKMILFDPIPAFKFLENIPMATLYSLYDDHYSNYGKGNERVYSKSKALDAIMNARGLTEQQAEVLLERNLTKVGEDLYKISWDRRLKTLAPLNLSYEYFVKLSTTLPPTLSIAANSSIAKFQDEKISDFITKLKEANFSEVVVDGSHDVHFTNPERVAQYVIPFLENNIVKSKI